MLKYSSSTLASQLVNLPNIYRPKRSFGQGNIFTPVCHSVHRGGACSKFPGGCLLQIFGGVPAPNFRGWGGWGVPAPNFRGWGGLGGACSKFWGGACSKFSGGGVPAPNFRGGCLLQIFGGVPAPNFRGGSSNFRNTVTVRPVRILLECILVLPIFSPLNLGIQFNSGNLLIDEYDNYRG